QGYEFIARLDAGDLVHEERLARQIAWLDRHPACMLVGCDTDVYNGSEYQFTITPPRNEKDLAAGLREHSWLLHSTLMFRAAVLAELGLYSEEFEAAEDHEICLRVATRYPIGVVPERLVSTIYTANGITFRKRRIQLISRLRIQSRYFSWASPGSYSGIFKCLVSLSLPASFVRWMKRTFIYRRTGGAAVESRAV
ncbi:MAG TPA: hypothetical protein VHC72_19370, partial [Bryobacteraceae bacterium]|nr:hypothetical protein [Bryobacteraceae bacterium]